MCRCQKTGNRSVRAPYKDPTNSQKRQKKTTGSKAKPTPRAEKVTENVSLAAACGTVFGICFELVPCRVIWRIRLPKVLRISLPKKKMLVLPHPRCDVVCDLCVWYRVSVMGEWLTPVYVMQVSDAEDIRVQKKAMSPATKVQPPKQCFIPRQTVTCSSDTQSNSHMQLRYPGKQKSTAQIPSQTALSPSDTQSNRNIQLRYPVKQHSSIQMPCQTEAFYCDTQSNRNVSAI